jgi:hypothetical protein
MAKVILPEENIRSETISYSTKAMALLGSLLGLLFWLLNMGVTKLIVEPIFCGGKNVSEACLNSVSISSDISTILVATIAIVLMINLKMVRPLIISVASAAVLWGLAVWTNGLFWLEAIAWSVILYAIAYVLFSWIARYLLIKPVLIAMVVVIILARVAVAL